jgi:hypothetical protein
MSTPLLPLSPGLYRTRNGRSVRLIRERDSLWLGQITWLRRLTQESPLGYRDWNEDGSSRQGDYWDLVERVEEPA